MKLKPKVVNILAKLPGISGYSLYGVLCNPLDAVIFEPLRRIKWFIQRGVRGYSDQDGWNLHSYLTWWLPKALHDLRWNKHGYPVGLKCSCEWDKILDKMIDGFEANRQIADLEFDFRTKKGMKKFRKLKRQEKEGLELFAKYYQSLWD